ncbi:MAG: hypothetical protein KatS3mg022_2475 [Armatimonadota bacterium]|nr:MAG: hypothetical protein KatS3mg022_2475 [Armatimonadota bacterium]
MNLYAYVGNGVVMSVDPIGFNVVDCDKLVRSLAERAKKVGELKDYYEKHRCLDKGHTKKAKQECETMADEIARFRKYCYKHPNYDELLGKWLKAYKFCVDYGSPRRWDVPEFIHEPGLKDCTIEACLALGIVRAGVICYRLGQQAVKCVPDLLRGLRPSPDLIPYMK